MPNKEKGEVTFHSEYVGKELLLKFDFNNLCYLEELMEQPIDQILDDFGKQKVGLSGIRKMFLAGLSSSKDYDSLPLDQRLEEAGKIIDGMGGGVLEVGNLINKALVAAFPVKDNAKGKKSKAAAGNGQP